MKKALLLANTDWYLYNFRLPLAGRLRDAGLEVVLVSPPGEYGQRMQDAGFRWIPVDFPTGTGNLLAEADLLRRLVLLYRRERPDLCHHFTIRAVLYGSLAARLSGGMPTVNAVTGLGHLFTDDGLKARSIRLAVQPLYRSILSGRKTRVIFQNEFDKEAFVDLGLVPGNRAVVIRSSGVDCNRFRPLPKDEGEDTGGTRVLFAARMLKEKGVMELLEAARLLADKEVRVSFVFAGDPYPGNPSSLTNTELESIFAEESITWLGHVDDMLSLIAASDVVVLPSYREGTPRIIAEAAAMEKPVVATDIPGCAGLVRHMENGILVPVKDSRALADAIELLAAQPDLRETMGRAGRRIVLDEFNEEHVNGRTLEVYRDLIDIAGQGDS